LRQDFSSNVVRFGKHLSPYTVRAVGERPTNGWPLFIAMHGGGGAPKSVNDSQWRVMQRYYRDHSEAGGYLYLALRAPNDTWNGFYDVYVYPLIANLIRQFQLFGEVDANKVFLMGYSHGGYGAFAIGPKMPDRFAAIHSSAAAPTDGETTAHTLRNTVFTSMVGEKDTMYGRVERVRKFATEIERLRGNRTDIYPVHIEVKEGHGHGGLPDRDRIKEMYSAVRNPVPRELTWLMTDKVITDFYWLHVPRPAKKQEVLASVRDNRVVVTANSNVAALTVFLDQRLVDFSKPIDIELNGSTTSHRVAPSLRTLCETLLRRGDVELAFTGRLDLALGEEKILPVVQP
jgi:predicted esterase